MRKWSIVHHPMHPFDFILIKYTQSQSKSTEREGDNPAKMLISWSCVFRSSNTMSQFAAIRVQYHQNQDPSLHFSSDPTPETHSGLDESLSAGPATSIPTTRRRFPARCLRPPPSARPQVRGTRASKSSRASLRLQCNRGATRGSIARNSIQSAAALF